MGEVDKLTNDWDCPEDESGQLLIAALVHCAEAFASMAGYACITERSPNSESTYIHVCRGEFWYGTRLSFHQPAYDCSRDYWQLLVPRSPTANDRLQLTRQILEITQNGGLIVADPRDVKRAIRRLHEFLLDGRVHVDRDGARWTWSSRHYVWTLMNKQSTDPANKAKRFRPRSPLSNRVRSAVRHRQNVQAKWSAELSRNESRS